MLPMTAGRILFLLLKFSRLFDFFRRCKYTYFSWKWYFFSMFFVIL